MECPSLDVRLSNAVGVNVDNVNPGCNGSPLGEERPKGAVANKTVVEVVEPSPQKLIEKCSLE